ncbi:MAG: enoyl-CoA hydratase-related protein [Solirubrobacteraceae bacterium]
MALDPSRYSFFDVQVRDGIAFVTINRPERANACDAADHGEFAAVLRDIAADGEVLVAVLHGAGRVFSVGATYDWMDELTREGEMLVELQSQVRELVRAHIDLDKPVVAAINGVATGSGLMFALLSDYVIMEEQAKLADGHVRAALAAGDGGVLIWPLAAGITRAKRYLLTGDWIDAGEAERIGLVTEIVPTGTSLQRATDVAERFRVMPQMAVRATKRAINQWLSVGMATSFDYSAALEMQTFSLGGEEVRAAVEMLRKGEMPPGGEV